MWRLLVATMLLLVVADAAAASTLTGEKDAGGTTIFTYAAGPGEANAVDVAIAGRKLTVTDPGATIQTSGACTVAGSVATCPTPRYFGFVAALGDGDDALSLPPTADGGGIAARRVEGGPGDDTIDASAMISLGGEGDDRLISARVDATLLGGPGVDELVGSNDSQNFQGGPGADTIRGGDGDGQIVSYAEATAPVTADLRRQGAMGPEGDQDTVTGIDGVIGGKNDDQLTGDDAGNKLTGGAGDDRIDGGGGNDDITPGKGDDHVSGGPGGDEIRDTVADAGAGTTLDGGGGADEIRATGGPSSVLGGTGNDEIVLGRNTERADGGGGDDVLFARRVPSAPDELGCGEGDDLAQDFGRVPAPLDCEQTGFRSPKVALSVPNAITLDGRRLAVPVPNLCIDEKCRVRAEVIVADRSGDRTTVRLRGRRNGQAAFDLRPPVARAIRRLRLATILYRAPDNAFFGDRYLTFPLA